MMVGRDCPVCGQEDAIGVIVRGWLSDVEAEVVRQDCGCVIRREQRFDLEQRVIDTARTERE